MYCLSTVFYSLCTVFFSRLTVFLLSLPVFLCLFLSYRLHCLFNVECLFATLCSLIRNKRVLSGQIVSRHSVSWECPLYSLQNNLSTLKISCVNSCVSFHLRQSINAITGSVSSISVEEGDEVLEGTEVAIVVAMKMNNSLKVELPFISNSFWYN